MIEKPDAFARRFDETNRVAIKLEVRARDLKIRDEVLYATRDAPIVAARIRAIFAELEK